MPTHTRPICTGTPSPPFQIPRAKAGRCRIWAAHTDNQTAPPCPPRSHMHLSWQRSRLTTTWPLAQEYHRPRAYRPGRSSPACSPGCCGYCWAERQPVPITWTHAALPPGLQPWSLLRPELPPTRGLPAVGREGPGFWRTEPAVGCMAGRAELRALAPQQGRSLPANSRKAAAAGTGMCLHRAAQDWPGYWVVSGHPHPQGRLPLVPVGGGGAGRPGRTDGAAPTGCGQGAASRRARVGMASF